MNRDLSAPTRPQPLEDEIAYDLVLDHAPLVMALDRHPRSLEELAAQVGESPAAVCERLAELLAAGLVEAQGSGYCACSATYALLRQEAGLDFLRDQVLPSLTPVLAGGTPDGVLRETKGLLDATGIGGLEQGAVARFGEALGRLPAPAPGEPRYLATVLVYGTVTPPPAGLTTPRERALWRLDEAARQRDEERALKREARSLIYQLRTLVDERGWQKTQRLIDELLLGIERGSGTTFFGLTLACLRKRAGMAREVA